MKPRDPNLTEYNVTITFSFIVNTVKEQFSRVNVSVNVSFMLYGLLSTGDCIVHQIVNRWVLVSLIIYTGLAAHVRIKIHNALSLTLVSRPEHYYSERVMI